VVAGWWLVVSGWCVVTGDRLAAQTPTSPSDTATQQPQPATRPLRPLPAFFHSLAIPGWAQAKLDRKLTATLFIAWEGVTIGMALKANGELNHLKQFQPDSSDRVIDKKKERQDWLILLAFNHLFSGLEAFVGSQLQDFPADVKFRASPYGAGIMGVVPFRIR
jgi:hypothetical protein